MFDTDSPDPHAAHDVNSTILAFGETVMHVLNLGRSIGTTEKRLAWSADKVDGGTLLKQEVRDVVAYTPAQRLAFARGFELARTAQPGIPEASMVRGIMRKLETEGHINALDVPGNLGASGDLHALLKQVMQHYCHLTLINPQRDFADAMAVQTLAAMGSETAEAGVNMHLFGLRTAAVAEGVRTGAIDSLAANRLRSAVVMLDGMLENVSVRPTPMLLQEGRDVVGEMVDHARRRHPQRIGDFIATALEVATQDDMNRARQAELNMAVLTQPRDKVEAQVDALLAPMMPPVLNRRTMLAMLADALNTPTR